MLYVIGFLLVITLIVLVHEAGHFFMARMLNIRVEEFAFGMGREVIGYTSKKSKIRYKLCLYPIGGYVKMFGDEDASGTKTDKKKVKEMSEKDKKTAFFYQPVWKRFLVIFAGPAMNYVFAILLLASIFMIAGYPKTPAVVSGFTETSVARAAGISEGDRLVEVDGRKISDFADVKKALLLSTKENVEVKVNRNDRVLSFMVTPEAKGDEKLIGVMFAIQTTGDSKGLPIGQAFAESIKMTKDLTLDTLVFLGQMMTRQRSADGLSGPIGIAEASGNALQSGILGFTLFVAYVSVGIGLLNLFPIPVLDGGHLVLLLVEAVTRKKPSEKVINWLFTIGLFLLVALMVFASWLDISRLWSKIFG